MSGKSQVKVYLPEELHDLLNADSRSNSEAVEAALWAEYGGQKKAAIEVRLENKRNQLKAAKDTLESERQNVTELENEVSKLQSMVETVEDKDEARIGDIDEILDDMVETGSSIWPKANQVEEIAREHYGGIGDRKEAFQDIKERAEERELDLPPEQFEYGRGDMR